MEVKIEQNEMEQNKTEENAVVPGKLYTLSRPKNQAVGQRLLCK